ncbi:unnamed protein product [Thelazia callipaeda]|uniref:t-SNARE coiled-coil homology domain-containing protein n=1 Tax=Thelazia callipaeda TaxID=103827 RepID=A0A0N5D7S1_THECL|nr:unnamed protein product [Thelazia callipaeda]
MLGRTLLRNLPCLSTQQISSRLLTVQNSLLQNADTQFHPSSDSVHELPFASTNRRKSLINIDFSINRVCLSGTVTAKPFFGTSRNGTKFGVIRICSNSFGGHYDFRVRLGTRTSIAYCRENVGEGSHLFVFGRLATFPRIAADGTQGSSGTIMASRISVEKNSVVVGEEHLEDDELSIVMSSNPFDDNYIDPSVYDGPIKSYTTVTESSTDGKLDDSINFYEQELELYMHQSLDSTQRATKNLEQSEQIGIAAAQDLITQREKLERTEKNLDDIDKTTKMTQRNLNSLKSVFGGFFKNKFSRAPKDEPQISPSKSDSVLGSTVGKLNISASAGHNYSYTTMSASGPTLSESSRAAIKGTRWEAMDNEIDSNLDLMSSQLSRLRMLGEAIGEEVESQNELLDRIQVKAENADTRVKDQDKQMKKLLGTADKDDLQSSLPSVSKKRLMYNAVKSAF